MILASPAQSDPLGRFSIPQGVTGDRHHCWENSLDRRDSLDLTATAAPN
jgi:hypothetical protein